MSDVVVAGHRWWPLMRESKTDLAPQFDPSSFEGATYQRWKDAGYFGADPRSAKETYVIVMPPPNVTAELHMGHGLNNTIQDVLIRWRRMQGREALWVPGTDHAGIATQNVVERQLAAEGKTRWDLGREAFVKRVWDWVGETGGTILDQLKSIGSSADWSRTCFTLDEAPSRAVREVFDLKPAGIIAALKLRGPIYRPTAAYGHFGRTPTDATVHGNAVRLFSWEDPSLASALEEATRQLEAVGT